MGKASLNWKVRFGSELSGKTNEKSIWEAAMWKNLEGANIQFLEEAEHDVEKNDGALEEGEDHADCDSADPGSDLQIDGLTPSPETSGHVWPLAMTRVGFNTFSKKKKMFRRIFW